MAWPQEVGPFIYVGNVASGTVSVIDASTKKETASIPVANSYSTGAIALSPNGKYAYVASDSGVSVINTSTNTVIGPLIPTGNGPNALAVTPDGKYVYVAALYRNTVTVIATATNAVVGSPIPVATRPVALAPSPDGKYVYVVSGSGYPGVLSVIATASNTVVNSIFVDDTPAGVAVTPDGKYVYVTHAVGESVWTIATATGTVVAAIPVGINPGAIAVTPDGKSVYFTSSGYTTGINVPVDGNVSIISTATNKVVGGPIYVGLQPQGLFVTPDGKSVYVVELDKNAIVRIETSTNTVAGPPIPVGNEPAGAATIPAPPGLPFSSFTISGLGLTHGATPNTSSFDYYATFVLGGFSNGIHPDFEPVTLELGVFSTTIPAGSFVKQTDGSFVYSKWIGGITYNATIRPQGGSTYWIHFSEAGLGSLPAISNPLQVTQVIGDDSGLVTVKADIN